jgi:hypothetical protein
LPSYISTINITIKSAELVSIVTYLSANLSSEPPTNFATIFLPYVHS